MRRELGGGGGTTQDGVGVATHVRKPGYSCTSPTRLLIPDRKLASSHRHMRQYVALLSWPVLTACLSFATPAAARSAHCFNVLSLHRARAARRHLGSSRHTTSVPIRTMQTLTVLIGVPCSRYFLSVRKPSTCLPTCSFHVISLSLSLCLLPRPPIRPQLSAAKCSACCPACD